MRWYRIIVIAGFFILFTLLLWWIYCALRAYAPQMTDIDVSRNNRPSTVILVLLLTFSALLIASATMRRWCGVLIKFMAKCKWILFGSMVIMQIVIMLAMGPFNDVDSGWIVQYVIDPNVITSKGLNGPDYFSNSPNNYLIYFIELGIHTFVPFADTLTNLTMTLRVLSVMIVDICAIAAYRLALRYGDSLIAHVVLFFWCALLGLSGWCLQPYSDVFCLPLGLALISLSLYFLQSDKLDLSYFKSVKNDLLLLLFGIVMAVTYAMKPSAVIPAFACIVLWILNQIRWRSFVPLLVVLAITGIGFVGTHVPYQHAVESQTIVPYNKDLTLPVQHFVMMGMANTGGYDDREYQFTMSKKTYEEKVKANDAVIVQRLEDYGVIGYTNFLLTKFRNFSSDGTFGMKRYTNIFHQKEFDNSTLVRFQNSRIGKMIANVYTSQSTQNVTLAQLQQTAFIMLVFGMLAGALFETRSYRSDSLMRDREMETNHRAPILLGISLLGSIMFLLIFESGHSRYLIQFFPVYAFFSAIGFRRVRDFMSSVAA